MKNSESKFFFGVILLLGVYNSIGQPNNENNQALIVIIGNPIPSDNINDFINTNPYPRESAPPVKKKSDNNLIIEPTLENGFHMRFEVGSSQSIDQLSSSSFSSSSDSSWKTRKTSVSFSQLSFNFKKKFRTWFPERKKKYKPHRCGRF